MTTHEGQSYGRRCARKIDTYTVQREMMKTHERTVAVTWFCLLDSQVTEEASAAEGTRVIVAVGT